MTLEIKGLDATLKNLQGVQRDLEGGPMVDAMRECTLLVTNDARRNAPVHTGQLRASILPEVRAAGNVVEGVVGSNVVYAPFAELGTRPHWPPFAPILRWVELKFGVQGSAAYAIARGVQKAIASKGTAAHPYLQPAFDQNQGAIESRIGNAVSEIVARGND